MLREVDDGDAARDTTAINVRRREEKWREAMRRRGRARGSVQCGRGNGAADAKGDGVVLRHHGRRRRWPRSSVQRWACVRDQQQR